MTKLNSITLSNIRRFSEDVKIDLGKEATIILAPNGTGKTAIFEAIELAFTKEVDRLGDRFTDFLPMIGESSTSASISLDFGTSGISKVLLAPNQSPVFHGDITSIYGGIPVDSLPFRFRMTHLLNQSQKNWFVQTSEKDGGSQLDHLSVGKDASLVNKKMNSAKRASTELLKKVEQSYEDSKRAQEDWLELLSQRNALAVGSGASLQSFEEIDKNLRALAEPYISLSEQYIPNTSFLKASIGEVSTTFDQEERRVNNKLLMLSEMRSAPSNYEGLIKNISVKKVLLDKNLEERKNIKIDIEKVEKLIINENYEHNQIIKKIELLTFVSNKLNEKKSLEEKFNRSNANLPILLKEIKKYKIKKEKAEKAYRSNLVFRDKEKSVSKESLAYSKMVEAIADWKKYSDRLHDLNEKEGELTKAIEEIELNLKVDKPKFSSLVTEYDQLKKDFENIKTSSNLINDAVISIGKNLPKQQDSCPVCNTFHGNTVLQQKITEALNSINPALDPAKNRLDKAESSLALVKTRIISSESLLKSKKDVKDTINAEKREVNEKISNFKGDIFLNCENINDALAYTEHAKYHLELSRKDLNEATPALSLIETESNLNEIKLTLSSFENKHTLERQNIEQYQLDLLSVNESLREYGDVSSVDNVDQLIAQEVIKQTKKSETLKDDKNTLNDLSVSLTKVNKYIEDAQQDIIRMTQAIDGVLERWKRVSESNTPSEEELTEAISENERILSLLSNKRHSLNSIEIELSKWSVMDNIKDLDLRLAKFKKLDVSDDEYTKLLDEKVKRSKNKATEIAEKNTILNNFYKCLKKELEDTQKLIHQIEPVRKKLLRKIVVDPRYDKTEMMTQRSYGKQKAGINTHLHDSNVPVSNIASEAQLTDLQLTYLLSMAKVHNWSPWKALLLDDPTQHHDLVHSAGVFDVLRDYIVDDGFQVLISTHDSTQANFFKRKLENDGVNVQVWELAAKENGVEAFAV